MINIRLDIYSNATIITFGKKIYRHIYLLFINIMIQVRHFSVYIDCSKLNKRRATQDARLVPATQRLKAALVLPEGDWTLKTSSRSAGKQHSQQTTHSHQKDVAAQEINVLTNISP